MPAPFLIPDSLVRTNTEQRGPEGVEWVRQLPSILAECERRWSLVIGPPFDMLSFNYAAPARRTDGSTLVIKVCYPNKEVNSEADALRHYDGSGCVRLLEFDPDSGVLLLEHIRPGTLLRSMEDDVAATSIAASVMREMRRPAPPEHQFQTVADLAAGLGKLRRRFGGGTGPFPAALVETAEGLFSELIGSMGEPVVLHGDLHHYNILAAERRPWLAIDPKGVVGEAEYETGALLRNPDVTVLTRDVLSRRIDQLVEELGYSRERIRGWATAHAVLSAWWFLGDSGDLNNPNLKRAIAFAGLMATVR